MTRLFVLAAAIASAPGLALAQDHSGHTMDHAGHAPAESPAPPADHAGHPAPTPETPMPMDHSGHTGHAMPDEGHAMSGALGPYASNREASGTAWQPDASPPMGRMVMRGGWMLMGHAMLNAVYDRQGGARGDEMGFIAGMVMGMAQRPVGAGGTLQLRAMLSPDPFMGNRGYPLLLASGETADGVDPLVDRQHPHDLFMELSASYSQRIAPNASLFVYGGLPGEPAFGPPAFMHRASIMDSPEAPISHHWLDSTHITFGVVTVGAVVGGFKLEASRFRGREPDQDRFDIETGPLDSTAIRLSWNPTANLSLQASWADVTSPEQLEPDEDQRRWSASAIYTVPLGANGWWSSTLAWGRRSSGHESLDAWVLESAAHRGPWTVFSRAERTENNELTAVGGHHGPTFTVGKVSAGAIHDWRIAEGVSFGVGGLYAVNFIPSGLRAAYGSDRSGAMAFVRLRIE